MQLESFSYLFTILNKKSNEIMAKTVSTYKPIPNTFLICLLSTPQVTRLSAFIPLLT